MRTSFATRIDTEKMTFGSLDGVRFNPNNLDENFAENTQKHAKLKFLEERVTKLEAEFKQHTTQNSQIKLAELMKDPAVKETLEELRLTKRQAQGLRFAIEDLESETQKEYNEEMKREEGERAKIQEDLEKANTSDETKN